MREPRVVCEQCDEEETCGYDHDPYLCDEERRQAHAEAEWEARTER